MTNSFEARVTKDSLVFSAAHFITFNGNVCEKLHGHNWRLDVTVGGSLDENGYVFDFIALRDCCQEIVTRLDHCVLLPDRHPAIHIRELEESSEIEARFENRRWIFPRGDCVILPVKNTTAELIAEWIGRQLVSMLSLNAVENIDILTVRVEENFGQWATVRLSV